MDTQKEKKKSPLHTLHSLDLEEKLCGRFWAQKSIDIWYKP